MNALKQRWQYWALRIDNLSFRERVLVFLAIAGVALSLLFIGLIEPALKQQEQMVQITAGIQQETLARHEQLAQKAHSDRSGQDDELKRLRAEAARIENDVKAREHGLISPERMVATLKTLLNEQAGLSLLALETGPARPAVDVAEGAVSDNPSRPMAAGEGLYKHEITLRVQGRYADFSAYLARLERMPWTVKWESVQVDASRHPHLVMTLKLNTLSREPTWARL